MAQTNTNLDQNKFAAAEELPKAQSKVKEFTKKFMKRKTAVVSLVFILFIVLMAIIAPLLFLTHRISRITQPFFRDQALLISGVQMSLARMYSAV